MWETIAQFVEAQLRDNKFFSGGAVLMAIGAALACLRELPGQLWRWLCSQFVIEVDILDRDPAFDWLDRWLAQHSSVCRRTRRLSLRTLPLEFRDREADPTGDHRPRILFTPAPGRHYLLYHGRVVILDRQRPQPNQSAQQAICMRESFNLTVFTRDRRIVQQLLEDVRETALPLGGDLLSVYRVRYSDWSEQMKRCRRPPESVVLRHGLMEDLISDCRRFLENRSWYVQRGIPYRRGYLLYGPPGTGKSSAVVALASALRMDVALLNLTSANLDDHELSTLLAEIPPNAVLLIEDIDCVFVQRQPTDEKSNRVTFSGLLNALDGVAAGEGRVLFATTNHIEKLDAALTRPGRIDRMIEIGLADRDQLRRLFLRFFDRCDPSLAELFARSLPENGLSPSAIQTYLIGHANSPENAAFGVDDGFAELSRSDWPVQVEKEAQASGRSVTVTTSSGEATSVTECDARFQVTA